METAADNGTEVDDGLAAVKPPDEATDDGWKTDKKKRQYIPAQGRNGIIYRRDGETVAQALARDQEPKEKAQRKSKAPGKPPPAPKHVDLREVEKILVDALCSPAMICAYAGDNWSANHFTNQGPNLARNLVVAAEHNPWLRRQLETAASGGDSMLKLMTLLGVGGALFGYAVPPIVYWFNLSVPDKAREMFGIPPERDAQARPQPAPPVAAAA